jgi:LuxR family maltose regulon positive regulatory protein
MAAVSLQGSPDRAAFVRSFAGSHRFVLDYLVSEVLEGQPAGIRQFLLLTAVLGRMCASLCEAVTLGAPGSGQAALEALERANLFLIPLDDERRWYRYHRLFADLLRQRLEQGARPDAADGDLPAPAVLHARASAWFEANGLPLEAFRHAALSGDSARADRLSDSRRLPLHLRSVSSEVIAWLDALPAGELDARPALRVKSATLCLLAGITTGVEAKLQAAEAALGARATGIPAPSGLEASAGLTRQAATQSPETRTPGGDDPAARALAGRIAAARATLALSQYRADEILPQARRALELLPPDDLSFRFTAVYTLAFAHLLMGDRDAAGHAYAEALAISREAGDPWSLTLALGGVAELQEMDNRLQEAAETYGAMLPLLGDHPQPNAGEAYLGLARIAYEWNDLADAEAHARRGLELSSQYDRAVDRFVPCEVFLARLALARGDAARAAAMLAETAETVRRRNFLLRLPEVAAAQAVAALRLGDLAAAARLAGDHDLPLIRARVLLARGNPAAALEVAEPLSRAMAARNWADERLRSRVLEALACDALGDRDAALRLLGDLLAQAEPERFVRTFLDEGPPMARLLSAAAARGIVPGYAARLAAAFETEPQRLPGGGRLSQPADAHRAGATAGAAGPGAPGPRPPVEPLSARELEVLRLVADGLTNQEIAGRLFLALDTVKGHNRRIFEKLQVQRRTEAVARARELDLL